MLNPGTGVVPLPDVPVMRASHRRAEYAAVHASVPLLMDWRILSDPEISFDVTENVLPSGQTLCGVKRIVATRFSTLARSARKVVPWEERSHSVGEISHYFDNLWVVTGDQSRLERLVCWHRGNGHFIALHHCPGSADEWEDYNSFFTLLEERWYWMNQG